MTQLISTLCLAGLVCFGATDSLHGAPPEPLNLSDYWDFSQARPVHFSVDNSEFSQDKEIEASGLCADDEAVYLLCENPAGINLITIVRIAITGEAPYSATVLQYPYDGPDTRQFEGMTLHNRTFYIAYEQGRSDETAAAGFLMQPQNGGTPRDYCPMPTGWQVVSTGRGRNVWGFEGMAVGNGNLYIMDERDRLPEDAAYPERRDRTMLYAIPEPQSAELPDVPTRRLALEPPGPAGTRDQRLTDIYAATLDKRGVILAAGSYGGSDRQWHYSLHAYDVQTGASLAEYVLPIADWAKQGDPDGDRLATNLEGMTLGPNGDLWLVTDNGFHTWDGITLLVHVPKKAGRSIR
jgi:hypothetical protein